MSKKGMVSGSVVVPISWLERYFAQQAELGRQLILGLKEPGKGLTPDQIQQAIEHRNPFAAPVSAEAPDIGFKPLSLRLAGRILGKAKLIGPNQACKVWGLPKPEAMPPIRYREETLVETARQNQQAGADWRLIYCHGMSLRRQREIRGTDTDKQPCFWKDSTWWLDPKEDGWAANSPDAGFRLVDFQPRWAGINWQAQEEELAKLGENFQRCCPHVFSEAIFTIFMVTRQRIAENWYHWSGIMDADRNRVYAGSLDAIGLFVRSDHPGHADSRLRACVFRKFDA